MNVSISPVTTNCKPAVCQHTNDRQIPFKSSQTAIKNITNMPSTTILSKKTSLGFSSLRRIVKNIVDKLSFTKKQLPVVETALVAYFMGLQRESDFFKEMTERSLKNEYITPGQKTTARILQELENKKVIQTERAWDAPRFDDGILTDRAYHDIIQKVKSAPPYLLNDVQKKEIINSLASSNYHSEDIILSNISFKGNIDDTTASVNTEDVASADDVADIDDGGILDAILDFLDDLF